MHANLEVQSYLITATESRRPENLYYVKLKTQVGYLYKIGYTSLPTVERRLNYEKPLTDCKIERVLFFKNIGISSQVEQELHSAYRHIACFANHSGGSHFPLWKNGQSELYSYDILGLDPEFDEQQHEESEFRIELRRLSGNSEVKSPNMPRIEKEKGRLMCLFLIPILIPLAIICAMFRGREYSHSDRSTPKGWETNRRREFLEDSNLSTQEKEILYQRSAPRFETTPSLNPFALLKKLSSDIESLKKMEAVYNDKPDFVKSSESEDNLCESMDWVHEVLFGNGSLETSYELWKLEHGHQESTQDFLRGFLVEPAIESVMKRDLAKVESLVNLKHIAEQLPTMMAPAMFEEWYGYVGVAKSCRMPELMTLLLDDKKAYEDFDEIIVSYYLTALRDLIEKGTLSEPHIKLPDDPIYTPEILDGDLFAFSMDEYFGIADFIACIRNELTAESIEIHPTEKSFDIAVRLRSRTIGLDETLLIEVLPYDHCDRGKLILNLKNFSEIYLSYCKHIEIPF